MYDEENKELVIEMTVPETAQAWEGFAHGGYLATLLDTGAGVAGFMEAIKMGKGIVTKEIDKITYKLPIPVGSLIKVRSNCLLAINRSRSLLGNRQRIDR